MSPQASQPEWEGGFKAYENKATDKNPRLFAIQNLLREKREKKKNGKIQRNYWEKKKKKQQNNQMKRMEKNQKQE